MEKNGIQLATEVERMTLLEIAAVTGKPYNDVLKAIRKMEDGWKKVAQGIISLSSNKQKNIQRL